jgi:PhoPQ-activated pathogenicity-related protein
MKILKITILIISYFCIQEGIAQSKSALPENALKSYVNFQDNAFSWELKDSLIDKEVTIYNLLLTSQKWREHTWRHQLSIIVPKNLEAETALLFITGGSNKEEKPNWSTSDALWPSLAQIAQKNRAVVALLKQAPNQPLYDNLTEDALISYTLHQYKKDKDVTWPLLFPMVKSAVKSMDAVQEFVSKKRKKSITGFVTSGASKRGWTTWLTAAIDDARVKAIAPMVIDMLNMPATLNYQFTTYGEYSIEIEDYVKLEIPQGTETPDGRNITTMIDPYSYRKKYNLPKMIFIGTNDPYWTVDATKHYINEIPGENLIHYVPNAGHNLAGGKQAFESLNSFFAITLKNIKYPVCVWDAKDTEHGVDFSLKTESENLVEAHLWETTSMDKDFRNNLWLNRKLKINDPSAIKFTKSYPKKGHQAFYVELKYKDPNGDIYSVCSRIFVSDTEKLWK